MNEPLLRYPVQQHAWVVADLTLTPTVEDAGLPHVQVVDAGGRTFGLTRGSTTNSCRLTQPGIPLRCSVAVELPADALAGAVLQLAPVPDPRFDHLLQVDLGLGADADPAPVAAAADDTASQPNRTLERTSS